MLSCKEITENANSYLDRELRFITRVKVKMHLLLCENCRRYMDQLQLTIQSLSKFRRDDTVSDDVVDKVVRSMKDCEHPSDK
ncbi:MAG: zf-HC2 domain-containing protein [Gammaproteobacteria bacterium]|jgi:predicted anti-sigma-YlaC factor YlaD